MFSLRNNIGNNKPRDFAWSIGLEPVDDFVKELTSKWTAYVICSVKEASLEYSRFALVEVVESGSKRIVLWFLWSGSGRVLGRGEGP